MEDRRLRYLLVGGWNAAFAYFVSLGLYHVLSAHLHIVIIGIIVNVICITMSFATYKLVVFKTHGNWIKEYARCYVVYGGSAAFSIACLWLLVNGLHIPYWVAQGAVLVASVAISYVGHARFTFRKRHADDSERNAYAPDV
ncbi:GtrA/DPMS transmembrane domain-containing protein [Pararobbsia alpina]